MSNDISAKLKEIFTPNVIIDVGANRGRWTQGILGVYPSAKVFMIEASSKHESKLKDVVKNKNVKQVDYKIALLSDVASNEVDFYGNGDTGNSMFREATSLYAKAEPIKLPTFTLDQLIGESFLQNAEVDLLKLDVQGAELVVLKGSSKTLKQAQFVLLETALVEFNAGGSCYWEIDALLRQEGYALYDLGDFNYQQGLFGTPGLGQMDMLYVNTNKRPDKLKEVGFCQGSVETSMTVTYDSLTDAASQIASKANRNKLEYMVVFLLGYLLCYLRTRWYRGKGRVE